MTRLEFIGSVTKRALRWISTGAAIGAYCGLFVGAIHGFVVMSIDYLIAIAVMLFFPSSVFAMTSLFDIAQSLFMIVLSTFGSALLSAMLGGLIGSFNFFVLSCSPHRFEWPQIVNAPAGRIRVVALRSSFIGAFCAATSAFLLFVVLRSAIDLSVVVAIYAVGALGGFAVGLFLGARNIIRENATRESSTR